MRFIRFITALLLLPVSAGASAMCFREAAEQYGIPEVLLQSIAKVESQNNPLAVNKNSNKSADYGLMQINSTHLDALAKWNIDKDALLKDACLNLKVGAWILADNIKRFGYNWNAIGAYNVGCKSLNKIECATRRNRYSNKIYAAMKSIQGEAFLVEPKPSRLTQEEDSRAGITTIIFKSAELPSEGSDT